MAPGIGSDDTIISAGDVIRKHKEHSSVEQIGHAFGEINGEFDFRHVNVDLIVQNIKNVSPKEATGYDKGQWRGALMFSLIHPAHYDFTVMQSESFMVIISNWYGHGTWT